MSARRKWDYRNCLDWEGVLKLGEDGWEMAGVGVNPGYSTVFYLKREILPDAPAPEKERDWIDATLVLPTPGEPVEALQHGTTLPREAVFHSKGVWHLYEVPCPAIKVTHWRPIAQAAEKTPQAPVRPFGFWGNWSWEAAEILSQACGHMLGKVTICLPNSKERRPLAFDVLEAEEIARQLSASIKEAKDWNANKLSP